MDVRIGTGYDLHRFGGGRQLILAGIHLEGELGLIGHSDADVVTHAIVDALLGAAGLGDIGTHFPSSEARWAGANSMDFLQQTISMLTERGWRTVNVDATVIAERPRLGPHIPAMRASLARVLEVDESNVSVKAKTNDGVGPVGAGEAIAALAATLIARGN